MHTEELGLCAQTLRQREGTANSAVLTEASLLLLALDP